MTPEEHYNHCVELRESRRMEIRYIPAVINHFGETVTVPGWHINLPRFRIPDDILPASYSPGTAVAGNRPSYRRRNKVQFGRAQERSAPTKGKAR